MAAGIMGVSRLKHHHSGRKLMASDVPLLFAGTVPFMVRQYRRAAVAAIGGAGAAIVAMAWIVTAFEGPLWDVGPRAAFVAGALAASLVTLRACGGATAFRATVGARDGAFASFMASLFDVKSWWPSRSLAMVDIAPEPLPLVAARPARTAVRPDIILVQHESTFDPRLYGLAAEPAVADFLSPPEGISGRLAVDIYGGGSWQSEFSVITGISSAAFGADGYHVFAKGAGRFHHGLARTLAQCGYRTMLASSCRRDFLSYEAFYKSVGMGERLYAEDLFGRGDVDRFEATRSDGLFLDAVARAHLQRATADPAPRFLYVLTNGNHGPHDRPRVDASLGEHRAFALAEFPDAQWGEYYARLAETAGAWSRFKRTLRAAFPGRPMLLVSYGDHQPVMTRRIERGRGLAEDAGRSLTTFYAIEALNFAFDRSVLENGAQLDIGCLGTVVQQIAGLPLDQVAATRASLRAASDTGWPAPEALRRFHRTLVDLGLIDLAPTPRRHSGRALNPDAAGGSRRDRGLPGRADRR
jgi:hypothetical protein